MVHSAVIIATKWKYGYLGDAKWSTEIEYVLLSHKCGDGKVYIGLLWWSPNSHIDVEYDGCSLENKIKVGKSVKHVLWDVGIRVLGSYPYPPLFDASSLIFLRFHG